MDVDIGGVVFSYDGRKSSIMMSTMLQNCRDLEHFENKMQRYVLYLSANLDIMKPEHLLLVSWHAGYELGNPSDFAGIAALGCDTVRTLKPGMVDHMVHERNPLRRFSNIELGASISYDYKRGHMIFRYGMPQLDWLLTHEVTHNQHLSAEYHTLDVKPQLDGILLDMAEDDF